VKDGKSRTRVT